MLGIGSLVFCYCEDVFEAGCQRRRQGRVTMRAEPVFLGNAVSHTVNLHAFVCEELRESWIRDLNQRTQHMFSPDERMPEIPRFRAGNLEKPVARNRQAASNQGQ